MKKFEVTITETLKKKVEVEAETQEEAEQIVTDDWYKGEHVLDYDNFTEVVFDAKEYEPEKIKVVLLEPGKVARAAEIDATLEGMQSIVGGDIEPGYYFEEPVCCIVNGEGKILGLDLNRGVYDENKQLTVVQYVKKNPNTNREIDKYLIDEMRKLDKLIEQQNLLCDNDIETPEQLEEYKDSCKSELQECDEARERYRKMVKAAGRKGDETEVAKIKDEISLLTERMKILRKDIRIFQRFNLGANNMECYHKHSRSTTGDRIFAFSALFCCRCDENLRQFC